jgi:hypothetical protein
MPARSRTPCDGTIVAVYEREGRARRLRRRDAQRYGDRGRGTEPRREADCVGPTNREDHRCCEP